MELCKEALEGLKRTDQQRAFHDVYVGHCAHVFGDVKASDHSEILIQAPRQTGKSESIAMFAAAMAKACPQLKICIYTACVQASIHMLNEVERFMELVGVSIRIVDDNEVHCEGGGVVSSYYARPWTTKGMDSDLIIMDDMASIERDFFYDTVAPVLVAQNTTLICISTPGSDANLFTRMCRHPAFNVA